MSTQDSITMDRRTAIKWVMAASAAFGMPASYGTAVAAGAALGYGKDPELIKAYQPGELWPLTLTSEQKQVTRVLCDAVIPPEGGSPSASSVGAVEFIDEWISAPYEAFSNDKPLVVNGLSWIDAEAQRRFNARWTMLNSTQIKAICDDIGLLSDAKPSDQQPSVFFARFRTLTAIAYYTTPVGMKDIGYVGNVPLAEYPGPPVDVMKKLGLS